MSVSTSSTGDVGTYTVKIKGEITGHATPTYSETLTIVVDLCTGVTLTTSSISDVTRDISESYTHNIVTLSWAQSLANCNVATTYTLKNNPD